MKNAAKFILAIATLLLPMQLLFAEEKPVKQIKITHGMSSSSVMVT